MLVFQFKIITTGVTSHVHSLSNLLKRYIIEFVHAIRSDWMDIYSL